MKTTQQFLEAVKAGDMARVKELIEADPSLVNSWFKNAHRFLTK